MKFVIVKTTIVEVEAHNLPDAISRANDPKNWLDEQAPEYEILRRDPEDGSLVLEGKW